MTNEQAGEQSQFFTLRVWCEAVGNGRTEFRGTLKHVLSGKTTHFRDWPTLIALIEDIWADSGKISSK
ncbi:MAG: hypothetical protein H6655_15405 [Ardenticatenaceae bacterium]|nr:hypothetical protein [Ardenticatenaceae bacterium]